MSEQPQPPYFCSFCSKPRWEVSILVTGGAGLGICPECVELCVQAIEEEKKRTEAKGDE